MNLIENPPLNFGEDRILWDHMWLLFGTLVKIRWRPSAMLDLYFSLFNHLVEFST